MAYGGNDVDISWQLFVEDLLIKEPNTYAVHCWKWHFTHTALVGLLDYSWMMKALILR